VGQKTLTEEFAGYALDLEQEDNECWWAVAQALAGYVERDGDLTLFTCDYSGRSRVAVRCVKQM